MSNPSGPGTLVFTNQTALLQARAIIGAWEQLPMPVIAAIDGVALGKRKI